MHGWEQGTATDSTRVTGTRGERRETGETDTTRRAVQTQGTQGNIARARTGEASAAVAYTRRADGRLAGLVYMYLEF